MRTPSAPATAGGLRVSSPRDPAEQEAEQTARKVMPQATPLSPSVARFEESVPLLRRASVPEIQRRADGPVDTGANVEADIRRSQAGGQPLPLSVRRLMEPRFRASFGGVRIHTGDK